jgi:hypothetical protein
MEIVVYGILPLKLYKIFSSLQEKFQKIILYFQSKFLYACIFGSYKLSLQL